MLMHIYLTLVAAVFHNTALLNEALSIFISLMAAFHFKYIYVHLDVYLRLEDVQGIIDAVCLPVRVDVAHSVN